MKAVGFVLDTSSHPEPSSRPLDDPLPHVRTTVRALLLSSPAYRELPPDGQRELASAMVRVCHAAVSLLKEEIDSRQEAEAAASSLSPPIDQAQSLPDAARVEPARPPLAYSQNAGSDFSGVAADRVAGTTKAILNAVSFPRFVTDLINGVFKAMLDSSAQQMNSYIELLNNVSASTEGFADANLSGDRARQWLVEKYPGSFEIERDSDDSEPDPDSPPPEATLRLKAGASMPSENALKTDLGLAENDSVPTGDPERTLVPLARARLARMRQEMLASLVMLGMQRIVVDSGRINASMRFHIDTRSAAQDDRGSTLSEQNTIKANASYNVGIWGMSAEMTNNFSYVSTERSQTTEEMDTSVDLNSSVEINFRSDYLPLNRLASPGQVDRIRANTRNPDAEAEQIASQERIARGGQYAASDQSRRESLDRALTPRPPQPASAQQSPAQQPASQQPVPRQTNSATRPDDGQRVGQTTTNNHTPPPPAK